LTKKNIDQSNKISKQQTIIMTATTATTRKNIGYGVRSAVIKDLWNTVREIPGIFKYNFSQDMAMEWLWERMMDGYENPKLKLNATSKYTFLCVRPIEWNEIALKCREKEVTYQLMHVAKIEPNKYAISDDMYSDDDLLDAPLKHL